MVPARLRCVLQTCSSTHHHLPHTTHPACHAVLMYDDVASSESNPYPGQLFNRPGGEDVYAGVQIVSPHACQRGGGTMAGERGCSMLAVRPGLDSNCTFSTTRPRCQDYSHTSVTADTFLAVLAGNASGVPPPSRHSSGRVLEAGPEDRVGARERVGLGWCGEGRGELAPRDGFRWVQGLGGLAAALPPLSRLASPCFLDTSPTLGMA